MAQLAQNAYRRPLFLESTESPNKVSGSAYAVLDSPLSTVSTAFKSPRRWCEVLILHLNTKYCHADTDTSPSTLKVDIGKKTPQALTDTFALAFSYRLVSASPTYLAVQLNADKGPVSTSDYRIELQAVPLPEGKTFMHLRYSYAYGTAGQKKVPYRRIARRKGGKERMFNRYRTKYLGRPWLARRWAGCHRGR